MNRILILSLSLLVSTGSFARTWSSASVVDDLELNADNGSITFRLPGNTIDTLEGADASCDIQLFWLDEAIAKPDVAASILMAAYAAGLKVRVLPASPSVCSTGRAVIRGIKLTED